MGQGSKRCLQHWQAGSLPLSRQRSQEYYAYIDLLLSGAPERHEVSSRDRIRVPCIGSTASKPLDWQGIPGKINKLKYWCLGPISRDSGLIGLRYSQFFKLQGDSNKLSLQPTLLLNRGAVCPGGFLSPASSCRRAGVWLLRMSTCSTPQRDSGWRCCFRGRRKHLSENRSPY